MQKNFLVIKNLSKIYNPDITDGVKALDNINITLNRGDYVSIVGSNAAGKSTLFNLITGRTHPTKGEIILDGNNITNFSEDKLAKFISSVKQNPNDSVINSMTVVENLALSLLKTEKSGLKPGVKMECKKRFISMLKPLNIGLETKLDVKMSDLSGGQKQTIALIMATLTKPKLLLLDEHTAALDLKVSHSILEITNQLVNKSKITTLMITHNIYQALNYGNRLILFNRGKIVFDVSGRRKKLLDVNKFERIFRNSMN